MNRLTHGPGCEKAPTIWATPLLTQKLNRSLIIGEIIDLLYLINLVSTSVLLTVFLSFKFSINWATSSVDDGNIKKN